MKHIRIFLGCLFVACLVAFGLTLRADAPTVEAYTPGPTGLAYSYPSTTSFTTDTITDTGADTLTMPLNLLSDLSYIYSITTTELTGTLDITATVQESNTLRGSTATDWRQVGTLSITSDTTLAITGSKIYGTQQRIILTGSGTQSSEYVLNARFKYNGNY